MNFIFIILICWLSLAKVQANSDDELSTATGEKRPRHNHGACKIVINEIFFGNKADSFIEISKLCGKNANVNTVIELKGYALLLILKQNEQFVCVKSEKLTNKELQAQSNEKGTQQESTAETILAVAASRSVSRLREQHLRRNINGGARRGYQPRPKFKVIINSQPPSVSGITTTEVNLAQPAAPNSRNKRDNKFELQSNAKMFYSVKLPNIQYFEDGVAVVVLLHIHSTAARSALPCTVGSVVSNENVVEIKKWLYDIQVLSSGSSIDSAVGFVESIITPKTNTAEMYNIVISMLPKEAHGTNEIYSYSKCDVGSKPRTPEGFKLALPTQNAKNKCETDRTFLLKPVVNFPFWFKGGEFLPQSNKLIVNLVQSLTFHQNNEQYMKREPKLLASLLLNIALKTVQKAEKKFKEKTIEIPKPKRARNSKLMTFMEDSNNKQLLRDTITGFYTQNKVPTVMMLHSAFKEKVQLRQLECLQKRGPATDCDVEEDLISCNQETFRKLLHREGYKFGALNHRYSVLFDPDKVRWRRKYLSKIREVRLKNEREIVYLDETWIDPNMLPKKGWIAKTCRDPREKAEFAYKNVKPGRGPRLIVLACGGKNGFITGSNLVWAINAKEADRDYHGNVNQESFERFFAELLDNLDKTGKKYFIVIDNAPYHSVLNAPKQTARKQEIVEFMRSEQKKGVEVPETFESMLLVDLKKALREMKKSKSYYRIDALAKERGHEVARIPAFNCDLNAIEAVWKDIKFKVMQENRDQSIQVLQQSTLIALNTYEKQKWENHDRHIQKVEQSYWDSDEKFDSALAHNVNIAYEDDLHEDGQPLCVDTEACSELEDTACDDSSNEEDGIVNNPKKPRTGIM